MARLLHDTTFNRPLQKPLTLSSAVTRCLGLSLLDSVTIPTSLRSFFVRLFVSLFISILLLFGSIYFGMRTNIYTDICICYIVYLILYSIYMRFQAILLYTYNVHSIFISFLKLNSIIIIYIDD